MTYTEDQIVAIDGTAWQGRNGVRRVYLNDWADLIGLDVGRYKSGHVCSATLQGQPLSNARASALSSCTVWWENGTIHATFDQDMARKTTVNLASALREGIARRIAEVEA